MQTRAPDSGVSVEWSLKLALQVKSKAAKISPVITS